MESQILRSRGVTIRCVTRDGRTVAYTDGACSGNPGPGGWGWVVPDGESAFGGAQETTNQRMELTAVLEALRSLPGRLHVVSDSTYVVNCFRDGWWEGWLKRGWTNAKKQPVANRDLWEPLIELFRERDVTFEWVKGHSGDRWNERADELAVAGRAQVAADAKSRSSSEPAGSGAAGHTSALPVARKVAIVGHRPPDIGGYEPNDVADRIRSRLTEILEAKTSMHDGLTVLSGLQLGAEQLGAEAAVAAGIPFVAVLAFPDPAARWPKSSQRRFDELLDRAADVVILDKAVPKSPAEAGKSFRRRDRWLETEADEAIVVWDHRSAAIGAQAKGFQSALGDDVWLLDPCNC